MPPKRKRELQPEDPAAGASPPPAKQPQPSTSSSSGSSPPRASASTAAATPTSTPPTSSAVNSSRPQATPSMVPILPRPSTSASTDKIYLSRMRAIAAWLREHRPEAIDMATGEMRIPAEKEHVLAFFRHLCRSDQERLVSFSCAAGYRSALVNAYTTQYTRMDPMLEMELRRLLKDYERVLHERKLGSGGDSGGVAPGRGGRGGLTGPSASGSMTPSSSPSRSPVRAAASTNSTKGLMPLARGPRAASGQRHAGTAASDGHAVSEMSVAGLLERLEYFERRVAELTSTVRSIEQTLPALVAARVLHLLQQERIGVSPGPVSTTAAAGAAPTRPRGQHGDEESTSSDEDGDRHDDAWKTWDWGDGGGVRFVPPKWEFPARLTVKALWDAWYFGDAALEVRPYRLLRPAADVQPEHQVRFTRATTVMEYLEELIDDHGLLRSPSAEVADLRPHEADEIFGRAFGIMVEELFGTATVDRVHEISYGTMYSNVVKQQQQRKEQEQQQPPQAH